jgi:hypothetical protein
MPLPVPMKCWCLCGTGACMVIVSTEVVLVLACWRLCDAGACIVHWRLCCSVGCVVPVPVWCWCLCSAVVPVVYEIIFSPKFTLIIFLCTAQGWQFSNIISDHNAPSVKKPSRGGRRKWAFLCEPSTKRPPRCRNPVAKELGLKECVPLHVSSTFCLTELQFSTSCWKKFILTW